MVVDRTDDIIGDRLSFGTLYGMGLRTQSSGIRKNYVRSLLAKSFKSQPKKTIDRYYIFDRFITYSFIVVFISW